eukprot:CAMPEP_0197621238 /NCGR_PEP_ID=MMETSP1338-20131121/1851_1 /TAXON_ID=43686 ORGANISM="Pelagodinium beii, Strain RCC1491" /NCGR_SAMPLE_ID=MMETSP1338 /ASSEMBLY_ACC=CAM_ASM_000754 /LENGTH=288 /DNA_ID=CAMNT_0043190625 /DNA_START=10 /DNA_END=876 /DNA_ORIENTATION=+
MGFFSTFNETRTFRMLVIPAFGFVVTQTMAVFNDFDPTVQDLMRKISIQEDHDSFDPMKGGARYNFALSNILNYRDKELWGMWVARWAIWHLVFLSATSFKLSILPKHMSWLPMLHCACMTGVMYSGFRQWPDRDTYLTYRDNFLTAHASFAIVVFMQNILETVMVWWPEKRTRTWIGCGTWGGLVALILVSKIPSVQTALEEERTGVFVPFGLIHDSVHNTFPKELLTQTAVLEVFEYTNFLLHFLVVWHRSGVVEKQIKAGTFHPKFVFPWQSLPKLPASGKKKGK